MHECFFLNKHLGMQILICSADIFEVKNEKRTWNWYGVKIIKQILVEGEPDKMLLDEFYEDDGKQDYEESLMLVRAQSFEHAYKVSEEKAKKDNDFYPNMYGQQVAWKFVEAVDCFLILDELKSGAEVYSCFHTTAKGMTTDEFLNLWFNNSDNGCHKARHM